MKAHAAALALVLALTGCEKPAIPKPAMTLAPLGVEMVNASATLTPIRILTGFDSITVGDAGRSWRTDMDAALRDRGFVPSWVVTAVGGTRCTGWAGLLPDLIKANSPDLVIVHCGTNDDVGTAAARTALANAHMSMIMSAKYAGVRVMVSTIQISNITNRPDLAWLPPYERMTNPILRANALFYGDVGFADIEQIPATPVNNPDGVHPSPTGQKLYSDAWIAAGAAQGWWAP